MFATSLDGTALAAFDGRALLLVLSLIALGVWAAMARTIRPAPPKYVWRCKVAGCNVEGDAETSTAADTGSRRHYMTTHYRPAYGCHPCRRGAHARCEGRANGCECACAYQPASVR